MTRSILLIDFMFSTYTQEKIMCTYFTLVYLHSPGQVTNGVIRYLHSYLCLRYVYSNSKTMRDFGWICRGRGGQDQQVYLLGNTSWRQYDVGAS